MQFKVETDSDSAILTQAQLLDLLMKQVVSNPKVDHTLLGTDFVKFLEGRQAITQINLNELAVMALAVGYYYRVFLEKNKVTKIEEQESNVQELPTETSGSTSTETSGS